MARKPLSATLLALLALLAPLPLPAPYNFDAIDDYVISSDAFFDDLNSGDVSIMMWLKADSAGEGNTGYTFTNGGAAENARVQINSSGFFDFKRVRATSNFNYVSSTAFPIDGAWRHVMFASATAGGDVCNICIDGVETAYSTSNNGNGAFIAASNFYVGNKSSQNHTWGGQIAEVAIYKGSFLTCAQEAVVYNWGRRANGPIVAAGQIGVSPDVYWPLDEFADGATASGSGAAKDRSGNGVAAAPANSPTGKGAFPH